MRQWSRLLNYIPSSQNLVIKAKNSDPIVLDVHQQRLHVGESVIPLSPKAFLLLQLLASREGQLISHKEITQLLWPDTFVDPNNHKKYILEIRRAVGDNPLKPRYIETLSKRGYRLLATVKLITSTSPNLYSSVSHGFVGRQENLSTLESLRTKALTGERQIIFITGMPGMGKSALIRHFLQSLPYPTRYFVASCIESKRSKEEFAPLSEIFENLCDSDVTNTVARTIFDYAPGWINHLSSPALRELNATATPRFQYISSPGILSREAIKIIELISQDELLILVIDDIQWADQTSLDVINALSRRDVPAKVLVIAAYRPLSRRGDNFLGRMQSHLTSHFHCTMMELKQLNRDEIASFVRNSMQNCPSAGPLIDVLYEQSEGIPFVMRALLEALLENGTCNKENGSWTVDLESLKSFPVPYRIAQFITYEMESLSRKERHILEAASRVGYHFSVEEVLAFIDLDKPYLSTEIAQFLESSTLFRHSIFNDGTTNSKHYRFAFPLLHKFVCDRAPSLFGQTTLRQLQ